MTIVDLTQDFLEELEKEFMAVTPKSTFRHFCSLQIPPSCHIQPKASSLISWITHRNFKFFSFLLKSASITQAQGLRFFFKLLSVDSNKNTCRKISSPKDLYSFSTPPPTAFKPKYNVLYKRNLGT